MFFVLKVATEIFEAEHGMEDFATFRNIFYVGKSKYPNAPNKQGYHAT